MWCFRTGETEAIVNEKCKSLSDAVTKRKVVLGENLTAMSTDITNMQSAAEGFAKTIEETSSVTKIINEIIDREPAHQAEINALLGSLETANEKHMDFVKSMVVCYFLPQFCNILFVFCLVYTFVVLTRLTQWEQ